MQLYFMGKTRMLGSILLVASILALFAEVQAVVPNTIYVSPFGSDRSPGTSALYPVQHIETALSLASPGDVILLEPGVYGGTENCVTYSVSVTLQASSNCTKRDPAVIDCASQCLYITSTAPFSVTIKGVSFQCGGPVMYYYYSVPVNATLDHVEVRNSASLISVGSYTTEMYITNSVIHTSGPLIQLISFSNSGTLYISNSTISGAGGLQCSYMACHLSDVVLTAPFSCGITNCTLDNVISDVVTGTAIYCSSSRYFKIQRSLIRNSQPTAIALNSVTAAYIEDTIISMNRNGSAVSITGPTKCNISRVLFTDNQGSTDSSLGGAIFVGSQAIVNVSHSIFFNNVAYDGGALYCQQNSSLSISNSIIKKNTAFFAGDYDCPVGANCITQYYNVVNEDNVSLTGPTICPT